MQFQLLVLDISEQSEVIDLINESVLWLKQSLPKLSIQVNANQLVPNSHECDYDFSKLKVDGYVHLALIHTKVFKTLGGNFRDKDWWLQFMRSIIDPSKTLCFFYSGDIDEFNNWIIQEDIKKEFPDFKIKLMDVFDLIYPQDFNKFEDWLKQQIAISLSAN